MKMSVCKIEYENWHTGTFMYDRNNQKKLLQYWQIYTTKGNWNYVKHYAFATNALKKYFSVHFTTDLTVQQLNMFFWRVYFC